MKKIIHIILVILSIQLYGQPEQFMLPNEDFSSDRRTIDFMPQDEINWLNSIKNQLILDKTDSTKNLLMEVIKIHRFSYLLKYEIAKYSNDFFGFYAIFPKLIETSKIDIKLISKSLQSNNNSKCKEALLQLCAKKYK